MHIRVINVGTCSPFQPNWPTRGRLIITVVHASYNNIYVYALFQTAVYAYFIHETQSWLLVSVRLIRLLNVEQLNILWYAFNVRHMYRQISNHYCRIRGLPTRSIASNFQNYYLNLHFCPCASVPTYHHADWITISTDVYITAAHSNVKPEKIFCRSGRGRRSCK